MKIWAIFGFLFMIAPFFAIVLCVGIIVSRIKYKKWKYKRERCTEKVTASVIQVLKKRPDVGSGFLYKPIFEVRQKNDRVIIDSAFYTNLLKLDEGDTVELLVDPENYQRFLFADTFYNREMVADFIACLCPFIMVMVWLIWLYFEH